MKINVALILKTLESKIAEAKIKADTYDDLQETASFPEDRERYIEIYRDWKACWMALNDFRKQLLDIGGKDNA